MKKITVLLLLTLPMITGFAQSAKLTNAINYLKDFKNHGDLESLQKAKENIDIVAANPEAKDPAKVQKVKGDVYVALFESNLKLQTDKLTSIADPTERTFAGYKNTSTTELDEAVKAYEASKTANAKSIYIPEISMAYNVILNHYFNMGNGSFTRGEYANALQQYEKASGVDDANDSSLLNNLAASALYAEDFKKAKASYTKMVDAKIGGAGAYNSLVHSYYNLKDTTGGFEILKKGRSLYPNDRGLLDRETNYYIGKGKKDEALKNLNQSIVNRPDEVTLYVVRGNVYDNMAHPKNDKGESLPEPTNSEELDKLAQDDYKKAISLFEAQYKPDATGEEAEQFKKMYAETLFNLGLLYSNKGAVTIKKADSITDQAKYAKENKKANDEFAKALPYLEKSLELKSDAQTMFALKQIYTRLDMSAKLKSINDKMKN